MTKRFPSGSTLIITVVFSSTFLILLTILASFASSLQLQARRQTNTLKAVSLGNGGLNTAIAKYRADSAYKGESYSLSTGDIEVYVRDYGTNKMVTSRSFVPSKANPSRICRTYQVIVNPSNKSIVPKTYVEINEPDCGANIPPDDVTSGDCEQLVYKSSFPRARFLSASAVDPVQNKIYLIGGESYGTSTSQITQYDPLTKTYLTKAHLPETLNSAAAVWNGSDNKMYILGGIERANFNRNGATDKVFSYDPTTNSVTNVGTLPGKRSLISATWDPQRNRIYVFGGQTDSALMGDIYEFDPVTGQSTSRGSLPSARRGTTAFWSTTNNQAYIVGGEDSTGKLRDIVAYNPTTSSATRVANMPSGRYNAGAAWSTTQQRGYIFGGLTDGTGGFDSTSQVLSFNPVNNSVTAVSSLPEKQGQTVATWDASTNTFYVFQGYQATNSRYGSLPVGDEVVSYAPATNTVARAAYLPFKSRAGIWNNSDKKAYFFGGGSENLAGGDIPGRALPQVASYDPQTTQTTATHDLPAAFVGASAIWDEQTNRAYIFGGVDNSGVWLDTIYQYDFASKTATALSLRLPSPRGYTAAAWDATNHRAYIIGGVSMSGANASMKNEIVEFDPRANQIRTVGSLPSGRSKVSTAFDEKSRMLYIFGGDSGSLLLDDIVAFNVTNNNVSLIGRLPTPRYDTAAIWSPTKNKAYIAGGYRTGMPDQSVVKDLVVFDPANAETPVQIIGTIPYATYGKYGMTSVWDQTKNVPYFFFGENADYYGQSPISSHVLTFGCTGPEDPEMKGTATPTPTPSPTPTATASPDPARDFIRFIMDLESRNDDVTFSAAHKVRLFEYKNNVRDTIVQKGATSFAQQAGSGLYWYSDFFSNEFPGSPSANIPTGTYCAEIDFTFKTGSNSKQTYTAATYTAYSDRATLNGLAGPFAYTSGSGPREVIGLQFQEPTGNDSTFCPTAEEFFR